MRNFSLFLIAVIVGLQFFIVPSTSVQACSCVEPFSIEDEVNRSDVVFIGQVYQIKDINRGGYSPKSVNFNVTKTYKGIDQTQVNITTGQGEGDCGFKFRVGAEYLVYANYSNMYDEEALITIICDRTTGIANAKQDLAVLGEGSEPSEKVDLQKNENLNYIVIGFIVFILLFLLVMIFLRKNIHKKRKD
ncbi:hypothetical protein [Chengkuizengella marina]|uniref:hypothetical protein n=1 Tax=Chengkuizengella marina TaxID=2507566 RepID=UPI0013707AB9|nr:hypothetical protein [Chengkuizengella marina]